VLSIVSRRNLVSLSRASGETPLDNFDSSLSLAATLLVVLGERPRGAVGDLERGAGACPRLPLCMSLGKVPPMLVRLPRGESHCLESDLGLSEKEPWRLELKADERRRGVPGDSHLGQGEHQNLA